MDFLADYLDGTLDPGVAAPLGRHLSGCRACMAYLKTYTSTKELIGRAGRVEVPGEMQTVLREALQGYLSRAAS